MSPRARSADVDEEELEDEEYEYEEVELEDEEPAPRARRGAFRAFGKWSPARLSGEAHQRSLALGLLAMVPMFLAYELALTQDPSLLRSHSELALFRAIEPLGDAVSAVRQGVLVVLLPLAAVLCYRRRIALGPSLLRIFLEGLLGAMLLGPALAFSVRFFGGIPEGIAGAAGRAADPGLSLAARIFGGAAYEELLFRVLLFSGIYLLSRRVALFFGVGERPSPWVAEAVALVVSALAFASAHLAWLNGWLGPGGEPFHSEIFTWRLLAGILLAILFRWRGPGVAAWTHGLFNLALLIGAGPQILL